MINNIFTLLSKCRIIFRGLKHICRLRSSGREWIWGRTGWHVLGLTFQIAVLIVLSAPLGKYIKYIGIRPLGIFLRLPLPQGRALQSPGHVWVGSWLAEPPRAYTQHLQI